MKPQTFEVRILSKSRLGFPEGCVWSRVLYRPVAEDIVRRLRELDHIEATIVPC